MKKNLLSVLILALMIVNVAISVITMISITGTIIFENNFLISSPPIGVYSIPSIQVLTLKCCICCPGV